MDAAPFIVYNYDGEGVFANEMRKKEKHCLNTYTTSYCNEVLTTPITAENALTLKI